MAILFDKNLDNLPVSTATSKKQINDELDKFGIDFLFKKLESVDP